MRSVTVRLEDLRTMILNIGFVGENEHTQIRFDCMKMFSQYPTASAAMTVQPPDGEAYPAIIERDGDFVIWMVSDSDLIAEGNGELQLSFTVDEVVAKTYIGRTKVCRSIMPTGEIPDPLDDFLTRASAALTAIPEEVAEAVDDAMDEISADAETLTAGSNATAIYDPETKVLTIGVPRGQKGTKGDDGHSPVVTAEKDGKVTTISVDDTPIATINDGLDGFSPSASVSKSGKVATVTITDKNGTTTAQISDGEDGQGTNIIDDEAGAGDTDKTFSADKLTTDHNSLLNAINVLQPTATSGDVGKFLKAKTVADGKVTEYEFGSGGGGGAVDDVQINGTSIVNQGVANVPVASSSTFGVIKPGNGVYVNNEGKMALDAAVESDIKAGTVSKPIPVSRQHISVYYGLSKLAGEDLKNDTVTVGQYPEKSKSAISEMLNGAVSVSGTTPSITAKAGVRYVCGEVSTLTIVVPASGCIDVTFESGSTATVLTVTPPTGVTAIKWANSFDPTNLDANTTYEINIMDGKYGVVGKWT